MINAIIFDLDGTAIESNPDAVPSQVMRDAIKNNRHTIKLCAATGRSWIQANKVITALGIKDLCIISGGTQIIDPITEAIVWEQRIAKSTALAILNIARQYAYEVTYSEGLSAKPWQSPDELAIDSDINAFYILNTPDAETADLITADLAHIREITVSKAPSWSIADGFDLHITHHEATKEHAIIELCEYLGLPRDNVAGVGDGHNDLHLFNAVGHKIAMGNAVPELKEAADEVIASQADDGLAHYINSQVRK